MLPTKDSVLCLTHHMDTNTHTYRYNFEILFLLVYLPYMPKDKIILFAHTDRNTCTHIKTYLQAETDIHRHMLTQRHTKSHAHKCTDTNINADTNTHRHILK